MKELKFRDPVFIAGRNLTVRRGVKWDSEREAKIDRGIDLFTFQITTVVMRFADLNDTDLSDEHDEKCRTVDGLFEVMCQLYPGFDIREIVTLVSFKI